MAIIAETAVRVETWRRFRQHVAVYRSTETMREHATFTVFGRAELDSDIAGPMVNLDDTRIYAGLVMDEDGASIPEWCLTPYVRSEVERQVVYQLIRAAKLGEQWGGEE